MTLPPQKRRRKKEKHSRLLATKTRQRKRQRLRPKQKRKQRKRSKERNVSAVKEKSRKNLRVSDRTTLVITPLYNLKKLPTRYGLRLKISNLSLPDKKYWFAVIYKLPVWSEAKVFLSWLDLLCTLFKVFVLRPRRERFLRP